MCPSIAVPEKFDLLSSQLLLDDLAKAKQNGINPVILNELQIEYAAKKFYNNPSVKNELESIFMLDPFPNVTEEEKMIRRANEGINQEDYVISCNIQQFVRRAMEEDPTFASKTLDQKNKVIRKFASDLIKKMSAKSEIMAAVGGGDSAGPNDLKYTVGGLSAMIEIAKAVSSGLYDREAAVQLIANRFGLTEEEARKQLGEPQIVNTPEQVDTITKLT